ncbi:family 16 glycosylhydrolase [Streptomyces sp. NPDC058417]|uniref:glycoside hydrolase family 16 protein n=1 Tax=unclassified Streptomyces TaxID=2593676 RepID=UPI003660D423
MQPRSASTPRRRLLAGAVGVVSVGSLLSGTGAATAVGGPAARAPQAAQAAQAAPAAPAEEPCSGPPASDPAATYPLDCLEPVFVDDFDGTALDPSKWNVRKTAWSNDANVSVSGGKLSVDMKRVSTSKERDGFRGGGISSKQRFGYGYYELTATIPHLTPGWHPAFWTQIWDGAEAKPVHERPFTELDIFEVQSTATCGGGSGSTKLDGGVITWKNDSSGTDVKNTHFTPRFSWTKPNGKSTWDEKHRYGLHYTPTTLTWVLDGKPVRSEPNPVKDPLPSTSTLPAAQYNSPMSIWISSILTTSQYIGDDVPVGHSFGTFDVDRIAYYAPGGEVPPPYDPTPMPPATTTFTEDFADGAGRWWQNPGSQWTVAAQNGGHTLRSTSASGDAIRLLGKPVTTPPQTNELPFTPEWTNVSAEATVTLDAAGQGAGLMGRAADAQNYYYLQLDPAKQQVALVKKVKGVSTVLATAPQALTTGTPYRLKLVIEDNTLTGWVNGVKKVTKDDFTFGTGRVGVKGYQQLFGVSDVKVTALG